MTNIRPLSFSNTLLHRGSFVYVSTRSIIMIVGCIQIAVFWDVTSFTAVNTEEHFSETS